MRALKNVFKTYWFEFLMCFVILFGILLRLKGFLTNPSLWHDECALAWNIKFKNYSDLFGILKYAQVAPPFFIMGTKLLTKILGFSEITFRLIPIVTGCLSLIAFYFLSVKALNKKFSIFSAVLLFAINQQLVNYSFEFKPYSSDVFLTIICLLFFIYLNIDKLDIKKTVFFGILLALAPWFSFVSVFIIVGGFLHLFFKNIKSNAVKKIVLALPILISGLVYLKVYLFTNYTGTPMVGNWQEQGSFVTLNLTHFTKLLICSIGYLFYPVCYMLLSLILFGCGIIIYVKEKSLFFTIAILSFVALIFASFLHIYPFADRVILFLTPIYLLFMLKPFDLISFKKKLISLIIIFIAILAFYHQFTWINYFINTKKAITKGTYAREMMTYLVEHVKEGDEIFVSDSSNTEFAYYSSFFNIKNQVIQQPQGSNHIKWLNYIKKKSFCWFYIAYGDPSLILTWINKNTKIIGMVSDKEVNNYLIYAYIK